MSNKTAELVRYPDAELVFGVVAPAGTDREEFLQKLEGHLRAYRYRAHVVRLSDFLKQFESQTGEFEIDETSESTRLDTLMRAGTALRQATGADDILALMAVAEVGNERREQSGEKDPAPLFRTAHVLWSLKHPDEVSLLQQVYGPGFFLIGLYSNEEARLQYLVTRKEMHREEARERIKRDADEEVTYGQHTRDTYHLADVFIPLGQPDTDPHIQRFLDLVFGDPRITPAPEEHAMFIAFAASLRSGALARQVGAVVVSRDGEILAVGANDAPRAKGGQYWPGNDDAREIARGFDANAAERNRIAKSVLAQLQQAAIIQALDESDIPKALAAIEASRLGDITEYGRDVHAEMEAILSCSRMGCSVRGATLFSTTFPCHNCAKHIIGAGMLRVVFLEPYPKSRALELHDDAMAVDEPNGSKVLFQPFIGVGPRRYFDLFSLRLGLGGQRKRKMGAEAVSWARGTAEPTTQLRPVNYIELETAAQRLLAKVTNFANGPNGGAK